MFDSSNKNNPSRRVVITSHNSKKYQVDGLSFDVTPGNHFFYWIPLEVRKKGIERVEIEEKKQESESSENENEEGE